MAILETVAKGFKIGLSRLRVRHSSAARTLVFRNSTTDSIYIRLPPEVMTGVIGEVVAANSTCPEYRDLYSDR